MVTSCKVKVKTDEVKGEGKDFLGFRLMVGYHILVANYISSNSDTV